MNYSIEKGFDGNNALHWASENGSFEIVKILIEKGIDIKQLNDNAENALHWASNFNKIKIVQIMIEMGIDVNQQNKLGQNALHLATIKGHKETFLCNRYSLNPSCHGMRQANA